MTFLAKANVYLLRRKYEELLVHFPIKFSRAVCDEKLEVIEGIYRTDALGAFSGGVLFDLLELPMDELEALRDRGRSFETAVLDTVLTPVDQECHAVSAYTWVMHPGLQLYTGLASDDTPHSWLYDSSQNTLYEPTTIDRRCYYGYQVDSPIRFVQEERENIDRLFNLGLLPVETREDFEHAVEYHFTSQ